MSFGKVHGSTERSTEARFAMEDVLELRYRSVSGFLVAYSTQLSRGELFIETSEPLPVNARALLRLRVRGAPVVVEIAGQVVWIRRVAIGPGQPAGMGIALTSSIEEHGGLIDELAARHERIRMSLTTTQPALRSVVGRYLQSIVACEIVDSEVGSGGGSSNAVDLAVVDLDSDADLGVLAIRALRERPDTAGVPVIALARSERDRARAAGWGVDEVLTSPPLFNELRDTVVNALSRPSLLRGESRPSD